MIKVVSVHNFKKNNIGAGVFYHNFFSAFKSRLIFLTEYQLTGGRNPFFLIANILALRKMTDVNIFHANFGSLCALVVAFSSAKKIVTIRGSDWYQEKEGSLKNRFRSYIQSKITKLVLNRFDLVICVSHRLRKEILAAFPHKHIIVLPSPVSSKLFFPISQVEAKKILGLSLDKFYIFSPSYRSDNPIKRTWFVSKVVVKLREAGLDIEVLEGTGIPHNKMIYYYNASSLVILASQYEGFPNVIKEAVLCGTPFSSTDVSDLSELAKLVSADLCFVGNLQVDKFVRHAKYIFENAARLNDSQISNIWKMVPTTSEYVDKMERIYIDVHQSVG